MRIDKCRSKKLDIKIKDAIKKNVIRCGDNIYIRKDIISMYGEPRENNYINCRVIASELDFFIVYSDEYNKFCEVNLILNKDELPKYKINTLSIGANPFKEYGVKIKKNLASFDSLMSRFEMEESRRIFGNGPYTINGVTINEINWDPFVYDKNGNKIKYQRGLVWTKKQKRSLITSIYNGVELGSVILRGRSWGSLTKLNDIYGETELAFFDIIDGKQRMNAIYEFVNNKFTDIHGNYYGDLSTSSKIKFKNLMLISLVEVDDCTDQQAIDQFLKTNISGVKVDNNHIKEVSSIYN